MDPQVILVVRRFSILGEGALTSQGYETCEELEALKKAWVGVTQISTLKQLEEEEEPKQKRYQHQQEQKGSKITLNPESLGENCFFLIF